MSQHPLRPLRLLVDLDQEIERAFSTLIHAPWGRPEVSGSWQPAIDLFETDDAYLIEADLPGVSRDDIKLRVEERRVVLQGHRRSVRVSQSERGLRIERAQGEFERAMTLDHAVDSNRVEVTCDQGILHVRLPKRDRNC